MRRDHHPAFEITLTPEPTYTPRSADNVRQYGREIALCEGGEFMTKLGVVVSSPAGVQNSVILLGCGGATTVHDHASVAHGDTLYLACGNAICALSLPDLTPVWVREVDLATCFGVHLLPGGTGLVSHGELSIARLSLSGEIAWSAGGRDIFTGPFVVAGNRVRAVDWDGVVYEFSLADGTVLVPEA